MPFSKAFETVKSVVIDRTTEELRRELPAYRGMPIEEVRRRVDAGLISYGKDLDEDEPHHFYQYWSQVSYDRANQGLPLQDLMRVLKIATKQATIGLREALAGEPDRQVRALERAYATTLTGVSSVYEGYERARMDVIDAQRSEIRELSTPIMPIYSGVLVLTIVGSVDSHRATNIMESLLEAISERSADVVIIDITGVPVIDTGVANHLLQAARAARLLGSKVVLVGIGAEIAQTIVQLGIDLSDITTRANLQSGIEYALSLMNLAIRPM